LVSGTNRQILTLTVQQLTMDGAQEVHNNGTLQDCDAEFQPVPHGGFSPPEQSKRTDQLSKGMEKNHNSSESAPEAPTLIGMCSRLSTPWKTYWMSE